MLAELNFVRPTVKPPHVDLTRPGWEDVLAVDRRTVDIAEARVGDNPRAELARSGFTAVPIEPVAFDAGSDAWREPFAAAVSNALRELVRCTGMLLAPATIVIRRGSGLGKDVPLTFCHSDFTATNTLARVALLAEKHPQARRFRRFAEYNIWWLTSAPPQDRPLALCDAASTAAADVSLGTALVHDAAGTPSHFGEIALYRYNPAQRWCWFPDLTPAHMLVFCGHDSDPRFASQVPHAAFANPACPPDAPTRVSVECRCFAYW